MFQKVSIFIDSKLRKHLQLPTYRMLYGDGIQQGFILAGYIPALELSPCVPFFSLSEEERNGYLVLAKKFLDGYHCESKVVIEHLRQAVRIEIVIAEGMRNKHLLWTLRCYRTSAKDPFYMLCFAIDFRGRICEAEHYKRDATIGSWHPI